MTKRLDADIKQIQRLWRAYARLSEAGKRPALRWLIERATEKAKAS